jgi:hypothetical protein
MVTMDGRDLPPLNLVPLESLAKLELKALRFPHWLHLGYL